MGDEKQAELGNLSKLLVESEEAHKREELMKVRSNNETFLNGLFLPKHQAVVPVSEDLPYAPNNIIWRNVLVFGAQSSGKTELVRKLTEIAVERYGSENVNAIQVPAEHLELAYRLLDRRPIQLILADDFTLIKHDVKTVSKFFRIRHIWREKTGRKNGYIITILGIHRFHALDKTYRNVFDYLLAKSAPDSAYDKRFLAQYFDERSLAKMAKIETGKWTDRSLFAYTLWRDKTGKQGFLKLDMAEKNYLNELSVAPDGRVHFKRWDEAEREKAVKPKKKKRTFPFDHTFFITLAFIGLIIQSWYLVGFALFLWAAYCLAFKVEPMKGERRLCSLCGRPLTKEEILAHEDFCNACYIEDLAVATIYDLPDEEV